MEIRADVWRRLASDMRPPSFEAFTEEISLDGLNDAFATLLAGRARGRYVVNLKA